LRPFLFLKPLLLKGFVTVKYFYRVTKKIYGPSETARVNAHQGLQTSSEKNIWPFFLSKRQ
jgi:hypothetical protein